MEPRTSAGWEFSLRPGLERVVPGGATFFCAYQQGTVVGQYDLRWAGPRGLYQVWHKPWRSFRARAVRHVYRSALSAGQVLALAPSQADYVDYHPCFWEKITITAAAGQQLSQAEFTYSELL